MERLSKRFKEHCVESQGFLYNPNFTNDLILKEPVAFDVDRVIEKIKEIGSRYCCSVKCPDNCEDCDHGYLMRYILESVKVGGISGGKGSKEEG